MQTKTIALPKLNNLTPTLESTALKVMEEAGELSEAIGKSRSLSGEKGALSRKEVTHIIARELLDIAQTAVTMMFVLEEEYDINIDTLLKDHIKKLIEKGYLRLDSPMELSSI